MSSLNIKRGDNVVIVAGNDKGKKGKVLSVDPREARIVVQNLNTVIRHKKPRQQGQEGGRVTMEAPIHISNAMLICPKCGKPTRVGHVVEGNKKYRVCKKKNCGKHID